MSAHPSAALSEHFSKFGHIVNVSIEQATKSAVVKFSSHSEAVKAIKSPEVFPSLC